MKLSFVTILSFVAAAPFVTQVFALEARQDTSTDDGATALPTDTGLPVDPSVTDTVSDALPSDSGISIPVEPSNPPIIEGPPSGSLPNTPVIPTPTVPTTSRSIQTSSHTNPSAGNPNASHPPAPSGSPDAAAGHVVPYVAALGSVAGVLFFSA